MSIKFLVLGGYFGFGGGGSADFIFMGMGIFLSDGASLGASPPLVFSAPSQLSFPLPAHP